MTYYRYQRPTLSFGGPTTRAVKMLIIANVAVFVLRFLVLYAGGALFGFDALFGLVPVLITRHFFLWQFFTYMFVHGGVFHILINMLVLWMFGCDLERTWGFNRFLRYYFVTGLGAGFCSYLVGPMARTATIGASGAIFGLLLAYGVLFADRIIYLYFLFPIKAKYFVMIMGALELYAVLTSSNTGIASMAHLGGIVVGYLYLKGGRLSHDLKGLWARWQLMAARRRFKVYMKEHQERYRSDRSDDKNGSPWIQ